MKVVNPVAIQRHPALFPVTDAPEQINLFVVGAPGIHSALLPMFGSTKAVPRAVQQPTGAR